MVLKALGGVLGEVWEALGGPFGRVWEALGGPEHFQGFLGDAS